MPPSSSSTWSARPNLATSEDPIAVTTSTWRDAWRDALGSGWQLQLAFIAICLFVAGALQPLADPDLPIHLAAGEWIVRHHRVPFEEVWAWTRAGAPFQAYSWAMEASYFLLLSRLGPSGLHVLLGLVYLGLAVAIFVLGRAAGWRPWTTIVVGGIQVAVVTGADPYLRPQAILAIATPLAWALVLRSRDARRLRWELIALTGLSAVVANTHLLFPILLAPCLLLLVRKPVEPIRRLTIPAAIIVGWFLTPYAFAWVAIYKLNFSPNAMINPPAIIAEYKPGFSLALMGGATSLLIPVFLLVVPWFAASRLSRIERLAYGLLWLGGGLLFALAARAILIWWLVTIPLAALGIELLPNPHAPMVRVTQRFALLAVAALFVVTGLRDLGDPWMRAGTVSWRTVPSLNARSMEPIAAWLDCNVRPDARGRLLTSFALGGYVPWRLPYLSESVDGRTIFPDSVAKAETYFSPTKPLITLQPWRTAELAIVPRSLPVAAVLDTARGWHLIATTTQLGDSASMIGLWATELWWSTAGIGQLPASVIPLPHDSSRAPVRRCRD